MAVQETLARLSSGGAGLAADAFCEHCLSDGDGPSGRKPERVLRAASAKKAPATSRKRSVFPNSAFVDDDN